MQFMSFFGCLILSICKYCISFNHVLRGSYVRLVRILNMLSSLNKDVILLLLFLLIIIIETVRFLFSYSAGTNIEHCST